MSWEDIRDSEDAEHLDAGGFWQAGEIGDFIVGKLLGMEEDPTYDRMRLNVRTPDGVTYIVPEYTHLENFQLSDRQGHFIGIAYVGEIETGGKNTMKEFEVVDFGETPPDDVTEFVEFSEPDDS